jgi:transposase
MSIDNINIDELLASVKKALKKDKNISKGLKTSIEMMIIVISLLANRLGLNSNNSSKPPSSDPNRKKEKRVSGKKRGGQKGHKGNTLKKVKEPDEIEEIKIDRSSLPKDEYKEVGYESRQVFDLDIQVVVTEYRAEIIQNSKGEKFTAEFPEGVTSPVQYGNTVKAHAVYLSQYQLLPYGRLAEYFRDQIGLPINQETIRNFNQKAYKKLENFEGFLKQKLINEKILHADETGINIDSKRQWLHGNSNEQWTYLFPHQKRGTEAMDAMGVLPEYHGILVHDHWKPYYQYENIIHALCNAHHLRELERVWEQDKQEWGKEMQKLLLEIKEEVDQSNGKLEPDKAEEWKEKYRKLLEEAQKECPPPKEPELKKGEKKKRGRLKRSKARNLLERLMNFENDVLRFMTEKIVPFTNNLGERDIRMTKVQQKISGCFRTLEGAKTFCRIRSYIASAKKNNISASEALISLFEDRNVFENFNS